MRNIYFVGAITVGAKLALPVVTKLVLATDRKFVA